MSRFATSLTVAILVSLAGSAAAQSRQEVPKDLFGLRLGQHLTGPRLTRGDLEGRVVLAYHWCVS